MDNLEPQIQGRDTENLTQKQARLRRERREAKIKAGGSARLEKITNLSGRQNLPEPSPTTLSTLSPPTHDDPEEVDLSVHPSADRTSDMNYGVPTEADVRALLRGGTPQLGVDGQQQQGEEDPMMKMLQQLMGGVPANEGESGESVGGLPHSLAAMMGASAMGGAGTKQEDTYGYLWKIVHAIVALVLGIYVTATSHAFNGDVSRGGILGAGHEGGVNAFWLFVTAELILQSSRFFLENGRGSQMGGWVWLVGNMFPEPWRGYANLAARYSGIWNTVIEDGMVIVFLFGCVAWWKGANR